MRTPQHVLIQRRKIAEQKRQTALIYGPRTKADQQPAVDLVRAMGIKR
jgi:hypothetical protein